MAANAALSVMRKSFEFPVWFTQSVFKQWYPGHMAKGLQVMSALVNRCDCVIEVHDGRIPFAGRNPNFHKYLSSKPRILLLNKVDLTDKSSLLPVVKNLKETYDEVIFADCKDQSNKGIRKIIPTALELIAESEALGSFEGRQKPNRPYYIIVCGIPNVGKSTLINALRNLHIKRGRATRIGPEPGVTRSVLMKIKIHEDPVMYIFDTPGVLSPYIKNDEDGMKLSLAGCLPDRVVGEDLIADYLLYTLNKHGAFEYVEKYGLPGPCDDFEKVIRYVARATGYLKSDGHPDYLRTSVSFISQFRKGHLGKVTLL